MADAEVLELLAVSLSAVAVMMTMIFGGVVLANTGAVDAKALRLLSTVSMKVTIPALLFTTAIACDPCGGPTVLDPDCRCRTLGEVVRSDWPLALYPALVMGIGIVVGALCAKASRCPEFAGGCAAAIAFGNSTGLPIVLLSVLSDAVGSRSSGRRLGDPLLHLSVYLTLYPVLQWSVGGWLLAPDCPCATALRDVECLSGEEDCPSPCSGTERGLLMSRPGLLHRLRHITEAALVPPVVAVLLGLLIRGTPVRGLLVSAGGGGAPLRFLFDGLKKLGQAAVPLNSIVLGGSLASGPDWSALPLRAALAVVAGKMVIMPAIAVGLVFGLSRLVPAVVGQDESLWLVALVVTATPTANSVQIMANVAGHGQAAMATAIFIQYMCAPFILAAWLTFFMTLLQSPWYLPGAADPAMSGVDLVASSWPLS